MRNGHKLQQLSARCWMQEHAECCRQTDREWTEGYNLQAVVNGIAVQAADLSQPVCHLYMIYSAIAFLSLS